jgi:threonine dehydrogenase-like Zn-dependent dehydrogenase
MKANCIQGRMKLRVDEVPDPKILNSRDAIVKISSTAICGSDLHMYDGYIPTVEKGDILGHEFMGEVVELGKDVRNLSVGDRVVVPFPIACGACGECQAEMYSLCENSNPNAWMAEKLWGYSPCGIFGYSHMLGGYPGGQAEYARVPFADVGPLKVPEELADEQVNAQEALREMTGGRGPDACIDAVGMESHTPGPSYLYDRAKQEAKLETDRPFALREAIMACRNGGTVSVIGVYGGFIDKFPMGAVMNRSLTIRTGQAHVHRYMRPLLERIRKGDIDPTFVITHTMPLDDAPLGYDIFLKKQDDCMKVVLKPPSNAAPCLPASSALTAPAVVVAEKLRYTVRQCRTAITRSSWQARED